MACLYQAGPQSNIFIYVGKRLCFLKMMGTKWLLECMPSAEEDVFSYLNFLTSFVAIRSSTKVPNRLFISCILSIVLQNIPTFSRIVEKQWSLCNFDRLLSEIYSSAS